MKPESGRVVPSRKAMRAVEKLLDHMLKHPEAFPDFVVVLPFDPRFLSSVFTEERLRLWAELRRTMPRSITEVAERLDRNVSRVRQDLLLLEQAGLAKLQKRGTKVEATSDALHIMIPSPA
ncbi:MAG: hypothetical protein HYT80_01780 [Euryarchaeota archaeon]|nr:hypothetical protein [Euryarchaeota archaeon]